MVLLAMLSIAIGFIFLIGSVVGVLRFSDGYQKMQAVTVATSMSLFWFVLGAVLYSGNVVFAVKGLLLYFFMLITSAISSNMLTSASLKAGIPMLGKINLFPKGGDNT